jgi:aerobic carbon-monoxide dehydrogenase large subunit
MAQLVGEAVRKHDGDEYLTGRAVYTGDVVLPGMTHAVLVRSPVAHAEIRGIDVAAAAAMPGVVAVLTGADAAELAGEVPYSVDPAPVGGHRTEVRALAVDRVRYAGEPLAAVVAETHGDALAAAQAVRLDLEALPAVLDADGALADGAPLLYPEWGTNRIIGGEAGSTAEEVEAAVAAAGHVLTGVLRTHRGNAAPIETRTHLASWDAAAGRLTLYATTQNPHQLRSTLAQSLGIPEARIHVIAPRIGGSFGLKMFGNREDFIVPILTRLVGRPVRWVEERAASLLPGARHQILRWRAAFDADGRLRALDVQQRSDHGVASPGHGWGMGLVGALTTGTGYRLDACRVVWDVVATNKAPWGGTKPYGKDGATLLGEHVMDRIAEVTGLDPVDVRRRNLLEPDAFPYAHQSGMELDSGDYAGALELALGRAGYAQLRTEQARAREQHRRLGIGIGFELTPESADIPGAFVTAFDTATVRMNPSGQATVLTGVTSPGSGNDTAIAQLVAQELGIELGAVEVVQGDSERCPYGFGNISSRSIVTGGSAAVLAARDIAAKLRTVAGAMLHAAEGEEVVLGGGRAQIAGDPDRHVPVGAVANAVSSLGYVLALGIEPNLESTRTFRPPNIRHLPDARGHIQVYTTYPYCVHVSLVELDAETGIVTPLRHVVAHDCGTIVNPALVDGQVRGGAVMGIGSALGEEFAYGADGLPRSTGFKTYLLPRAPDVPEIELERQVTPSPSTLLGAKGAGEAGFGGAQAAVLNAVNDALRDLGARLDATPASPPNVLAAILEAAA